MTPDATPVAGTEITIWPSFPVRKLSETPEFNLQSGMRWVATPKVLAKIRKDVFDIDVPKP